MVRDSSHISRVSPRVNAHAELFVGSGAPGAEFDAAVGEMVHHRHALGHPDRVVVGQDDHPESQADALGQPGQRAEDDLGTGRGGERGQEVVLDKPHSIETHLIGQYALLDGFFDDGVVVQHRALHLIGQRKFHFEPSN